MKPKITRRLIMLLAFMLADYNVLASMTCMKGCEHGSHIRCSPDSTGCSDGEICSRFQIASVQTAMGDKLENMVTMQCMSKEECKTNKEASETDLQTTAQTLGELLGNALQRPSGKIEFACCDQNYCNSEPVSEMKIDQVEASGAGGIFENHFMFYMALSSTFIYFSS